MGTTLKISFRNNYKQKAHMGLTPRAEDKGPTLTKFLTKCQSQQVSVMPLTEIPVLSTPLSVDSDAYSVVDHTHKQTVHLISSGVHSLVGTPMKYVELCNTLSLYPVTSEQMQLIHGFLIWFHLHYAGPWANRDANDLKLAYLSP